MAAFARAGRRSLAAALLLALALPAALLLLAGPAAAQEVVEVPRAWALTPSEISTDGKFRLLFVTSGTRAGNSGNIGDYNSFVQRQAGGGAEAIRRYASRFRALASTLPTAARDNTATTYTNDDKGVPIYWLGGDKVADDYEGFYDGSWDNKNGKGKNQSGNDFNSNSWIWSGTSDDGTSAPINRQFEQFTAPLGAAFSVSRIKLRDTETLLKIHQTGTATDSHHLFALSPVFKLAGSVKPFGVSITSAPANATLGYAMGETIQVRVDFGEAVTVTGAPYLVLNVGGVARTAVYDSGAGTRDLNFEYTVVRGETDADGVSLCADTMLDSGCGRITLNNGSITADSDSAAILLDLPDLGNQSGHKVDGVAEAKEVSITSTPADTAAGYAAGETIQVRVDFGEAVTVTGAPYLVLNVGGVARTAVYDPGSGARNLNFGYTVQAGDFDSNGISLCSSRLLDMDCGRITLDGGSIQANADNVAAELDLPELGNQSGHKVDGQPVTGSTPMTPAGAVAVPSGWDLVPPGVTRSFRLLFVSSTTRDATSSDINDYNNHVISAAGSGHSAIQAYKDGFRAIASTAAVDARDNAGLTGTGAPIYWLNGAKVAENNNDLLDGSWGSESWTTEAGGAASSSQRFVWTGSTNAGVEHFFSSVSQALGAATHSAIGNLNGAEAPLLAGSSLRTETYSLYGLSQVLWAPPGFASAAFVSTPRNARFYRLGETIAVEWTFTEPVTVRGVPTLALTMRGPADTLGAGVRPMRYISGSGTATLRFEYTVQQGDFTSNETEPLGIQAAAGASPFTLDGAVIRAVADNAEADLVPSADTDFLETSDANHKVETRPVPVMGASVSSSPASGTTYGAGETMTVSLAMREAVRVTGRPYIWLDVGGAQRRANYAGPIGESTAALEFSYTVQAGDRDADGVALCASGPGCGAIQLNGGSIRGVADGLDANLALPQMAAQSGHKVDGMPPSIPTACTDEISVPHDWALKPSGVAAGAKFRLLFVTSTSRTASSTNIADYNRFVQGRAATGHADIRPYSKGVRVLGSTQAVNARVNTCTRSSSTDAAVYWLNGAKVADNYTGLYDGSWDSGADRRESGAELTGDARIWTGTNNNGTTADFLGKSGSGGRDVTFGRSNQVDSPLESGLGTRTNNFRIYGLSQIFVAKATRTAPSATAISITSSPVIGDTYLLGETIEFEVTYSEAVDVRGTPRIGLAVSTHDRSFLVEFEAAYVRGSGTNKLVFAWDVSDRAQDSNGIQTFPNTLRLNGATITAMSDGFPAVWSIPAWRNIGGKVDGTQTVSTDGVCGRTKEVRDVIVGKVSAASDCSQVTDAHLAAITGSSASFRVGGLTSLKLGDFAGLSGVGQLILSGSGIETLPVGLFDGLDSLLTLTVVTGLTHLPKDIFRGLGDILIGLNLSGEGTGGTSRNSLAAGSLPDGVFEPLTKLETLTLTGNPGFDTFKPAADAGPGGTLTAGETVMLGGPGTSGGPWGSNVTHAWTQTDGDDMAASTVTLSATDVAKPGFTVPVLVSETDREARPDGHGPGRRHGPCLADLHGGIHDPGAGADRAGGDLEADCRLDLQAGRDDRDRGDLRRPGAGGHLAGHARADPLGGSGRAPRKLRPGLGDQPAGVRIHDRGWCGNHPDGYGRHLRPGERPGAERRGDCEPLRRGGDPRPRCGCGAVGPQGGRVDDPQLQPDGRRLRAHGADTRQAGGAGQGERYGPSRTARW